LLRRFAGILVREGNRKFLLEHLLLQPTSTYIYLQQQDFLLQEAAFPGRTFSQLFAHQIPAASRAS